MGKKILVTGGSGLVGNYLKHFLPNAIYISSKDFDLTKEIDVENMFSKYNPEIVIHLAAKVGGIMDNIKKPAEYFTENILMNTLVLEYSRKFNVNRFIGVLSTCIYPDVVDVYPMKESDLHLGPPTKTNFSYGYAKRSLAVQIDAYNEQYKTNYQYLIPCNLYGVGDKDDEKHSHFITALVKKIFESNIKGKDNITLFGDGSPLRQFMYAKDFAEIIYKVITDDVFENLNVASHENFSIREMADIALVSCNSQHLTINWDSTKPNGQFRKDVSIDKLRKQFPDFTPTSLSEGIKIVYNSYYDKISK